VRIGEYPIPGEALPGYPLRRQRRGPHLPAGWAIYLLFGGLFVWWFLGLSGFVQSLLALPLLLALVFRFRGVAMPKGFWFWLLFLLFMFMSATQLSGLDNILSWGWRMTIYVGATIMFLYVFNSPREALSAKTIMNVLAAFWVLTVIGGLMSMALPNHSFSSLMEHVMPHRYLSNAFVKALVIPSTTGGNAFPGLGIYRVKAPFIYTNQWGSAFALTLPFAFAVITQTRNRLTRLAFVGLLILAVIPLVFSLDRGSWLSASAGSAYGIFRLAQHGRGRSRRMAKAARALLFTGVVVVALVLVSPLGGYILTRLNSGYGDTHRQILYSSSLTLIRRSPVLGFGAPVSLNVLNPAAPPGPSIGTHGTLWTILISNGIPALVFFGLWMLYALFKTGRRITGEGGRDAEAHFWCHVVIFTAVIQLPYYELLPWGLPIVMIAAATAMRERRARYPVASAQPSPSTRLAVVGRSPTRR
jgi:polysaccharide biosynthesis protein PslJ